MNIQLPPSVQSTADAARKHAPRNRSGRFIVAGIVIVLVLAVLWRVGMILFGSGEHQKPPAPVIVSKVVERNVTGFERTIGTVVANATVQITSRVDGQIESAAFTEGQMVKQGDILFRLDPKPFEAALAQAKANMARDAASLVSANNDARRYGILARQGAASGSQRDQSEAQAKALAATVAADKAAMDMAALNLEWSVIRAPVDGKTGPILIQPGNIVKANDTNALVTITQIHPVKVSFFLPQSDVPKIQERMQADTLTAIVQAHGADETRESAKVDFVGNAVSAQTGTIELRATFPNADGRLVPGQVVDVSVALSDFNKTLVVPHEAVNVGPDGRYVYAVEDGKARLVPVQVLDDDGETAAVSGALKPGEMVITEGQLRVIPGKPVQVKSAARASSKP